ncbi:MAG: excisionase family DNA-binding protein [Propionibacteriaceae bacterium]
MRNEGSVDDHGALAERARGGRTRHHHTLSASANRRKRIRFVRVGRHVRIPESAIEEFVEAGTVQPITWTKVS